MNNGRLYHSKNGIAHRAARTDERLPRKNLERRKQVIAEHLATNFSEAPTVKALGLKRVKPVVEGDTLYVDTELGLFTLNEIMGAIPDLPTPQHIVNETLIIHEQREFVEDQPVYPDFTKQVVVTLQQGTSRRSEDY